jgi:hypothetical protein
MPKYRINYTIERWEFVEVEAESEAEARRLFWEDEIDYQTNPPTLVGDQLSDYILVVEKEQVNA